MVSSINYILNRHPGFRKKIRGFSPYETRNRQKLLGVWWRSNLMCGWRPRGAWDFTLWKGHNDPAVLTIKGLVIFKGPTMKTKDKWVAGAYLDDHRSYTEWVVTVVNPIYKPWMAVWKGSHNPILRGQQQQQQQQQIMRINRLLHPGMILQVASLWISSVDGRISYKQPPWHVWNPVNNGISTTNLNWWNLAGFLVAINYVWTDS